MKTVTCTRRKNALLSFALIAVIITASLVCLPERYLIANASSIDDPGVAQSKGYLDIINLRLKKSNYTAWRFRSTKRITKSTYNSLSEYDKFYWQLSGDYAYSTNKKDDNHAKKREFYSGLCTWCAMRDLINRRLAYDDSDNTPELVSFREIAEAITYAEGYRNFQAGYKEIPNDASFFTYLDGYNVDGNLKEVLDTTYNYSFANGRSGAYTVGKEDASGKVNERKERLRTLLLEHPEGVLVYLENHGVLLTGYYRDNDGNIQFYVHDTANPYYGEINPDTNAPTDPNWKLNNTKIYITNTYGNNSADTVISKLKYYCYITSTLTEPVPIVTGPSPTATPTATPTPAPSSTAKVTYSNFWLGSTEHTPKLAEGSKCNINGTVSGVGIAKIEAFIAVLGNYTTPIRYTNGNQAIVSKNFNPSQNINYTLRSSELDNALTFGKIAPGKYNLVVRARDSAGNTIGIPDGVAIEFEVLPAKKTANGITIDLTGFDTNRTYNSSYTMPGVITSSATIRTVEVAVLNNTGTFVVSYRSNFRKTGLVRYTHFFPNTTKYYLSNSVVDNNTSFGGLNRGSYILQIKVYDVNSNSCTLQLPFQVK